MAIEMHLNGEHDFLIHWNCFFLIFLTHPFGKPQLLPFPLTILSLDHPWPHQARCEAVNLVGQIEDFGGEGWAMGPWVDGTFWR